MQGILSNRFDATYIIGVLDGLFVNLLYVYFYETVPSSESYGRCKKQKSLQINDLQTLFAVRTGLEPATPCVTGRYSNQLNYRTVFQLFKSIANVILLI